MTARVEPNPPAPRIGVPATPQTLALRAGPLQLRWEEGGLRTIRHGPTEIVRRIYVAVRDRNWGTTPARLTVLEARVGADAFTLVVAAETDDPEIRFAWRSTIRGEADGTIGFTMEGEARSDFLRNRIGFCVLHPPECQGARCRLRRADGTWTEAAFPQQIAPENPFQDLRGLAHEFAAGAWCRLEFEGELFETEDQRNWTDASFKTFCTPLRLPFPVPVRTGDLVRQAVRLTLELPPGLPVFTGETAPRNKLEPWTDWRAPLPPIGVGFTAEGAELNESEVRRLRALAPGHLRVDLHLAQPGFAVRLGAATRAAVALGVPLEVALFVTDNAVDELRSLVSAVTILEPVVVRWLVFHPQEPAMANLRWVSFARFHLSRLTPRAAFGSGTDGAFVEINRRRPPAAGLDFVSFTINPQVHAADDESLMETLEMQAAVVESARDFIGPAPLVVSPITLKMRHNFAATGAERPPPPGALPAGVDPRQATLFGAAWTLGSIKYLSEARATALTYYETTGWRGVMERPTGSPLPEKFPSRPGAVFPLYHVLADINEFARGRVIACRSSDPLQVVALMLGRAGAKRLLVANLTAQPQPALVEGMFGGHEPLTVKRLHGGNVIEATTQPERFRAQPGLPAACAGGVLRLELAPFEIARIDATHDL